jgi:hypothetical protein
MLEWPNARRPIRNSGKGGTVDTMAASIIRQAGWCIEEVVPMKHRIRYLVINNKLFNKG